MAITGTGTQANPYVIDTYEDWKAVCTGQNTYWTRGNDFWMKLNADIDCTGITWIDLKGTNIPKLHFDLDGHSITGVVVSNTCTYGFFIGVELCNGSISLQGHELYEQLFTYSYDYNTPVELHHLNIEILDVTWIPEDSGYDFYYQSPIVFLVTNIRYCNITATVHFPDETQYSYGSNTAGYFLAVKSTMEYTDFNLQIYGNYAYYNKNIDAMTRYSLFYNCNALQYCRVRETLHNSTVSLTGVLARKTSFAYCVLEVDYSEAVIPVDVNYGAATLIYADGASASNTTIMHVTYPAGETHYTIGTGVTPLTESEIRHYADITAVNFPITRTGETQPTGYRWWITDGSLPYLDSFIPDPTPPTPGGDKAVYRYYTDTGWVKEGSIYVRENGAWSAGSGSIKILDGWSPKDWGTLYPRVGNQVWKHGGHIYYNGGIMSWEFDRVNKLWVEKTWVGLNFTSSDSAVDMWTDGVNRYYSYSNKQLVLNNTTLEWSVKSWNGYTPYYGRNIWTDDEHIYYSSGSNQYVLNVETSTWTPVTWGGLSNPAGNFIWHDGNTIYYSQNALQYVLDKSTATWVAKTWTGLQPGSGGYVWTDGTNIYFSDGTSQFVLDSATSTWTVKTWSGLTSFSGMNVWTDDETYYYSGYTTADQYYATGHVVPGPVQELKIHERVSDQWQDK